MPRHCIPGEDSLISKERNMAGNPKAQALRDRLAKGEFILAPGIYDGISARVADGMGFPALYMTGYGATASMLGLPDAGLATYSDMVGRAEMICSVVGTPLIADADTGYGGLLNVQRTVRGYEAAGVAAIQIEDQEMPKKCGHTPGRRVVPRRARASHSLRAQHTLRSLPHHVRDALSRDHGRPGWDRPVHDRALR